MQTILHEQYRIAFYFDRMKMKTTFTFFTLKKKDCHFFSLFFSAVRFGGGRVKRLNETNEIEYPGQIFSTINKFRN